MNTYIVIVKDRNTKKKVRLVVSALDVEDAKDHAIRYGVVEKVYLNRKLMWRK